MSKDYSRSRYKVLDESGAHVGTIDNDEFVRDAENKFIYRIDGDEVYLPGKPPVGGGLLGFIDNGEARAPGGQFLFKIVDEF